MLLTELAAKGLEMMAEALPQTRRIGVLWNPTTPSHSRALPAVETAGEKLALELRMVPARRLEDFDSAFAMMAQERVGAFLAVGSPLVVGQRVPLAALALKHRLPGMFPFKENVVAGGLMSYGADPNYLYRRAAGYIDKIRVLRRLVRSYRPQWFLRLRELVVQFAVAHRSDQDVDDHGDLVGRRNGDGVLALVKLNRFRS
jgi:ABC transporter substrate binding protein